MVVSGIDPQAVTNLVSDINGLKSQMSSQLERVRTDVLQRIQQNYEGSAAESLIANISTNIPKIEAFLDVLMNTLVGNINDDLSDTQNTDRSLAGGM